MRSGCGSAARCSRARWCRRCEVDAVRLAIASVRCAVIVAPHPDDEMIGAAGLIGALRLQGSDVHVIVVSDGAASHPGSVRWPRKRLVAARRQESLRALRRLMVLPSRVTFLGLPDGALTGDVARCRLRLHRRLARCGADLLVAPAASDAHPDHQAVAAALSQWRCGARRLSYQVWPPRRRSGTRIRTVVTRGAAKRSLIRMHRTQLGAIADDPSGFAIARHELAVFAHPIERFVEAWR
jgi:LmbE family N-acetylglucosaminyl deacetylase